MPKKYLGYRAFNHAFVLHMQRHGGFGPDKYVRDWFSKHEAGAKAEFLAEAKQGFHAPDKCAAGLIKMLLTTERVAETHHARLALARFMRDRGFDPIDENDLERVLSHVCTPIVGTPPEGPEHSSGLSALFQGAVALLNFPADYMLYHAVKGCHPYKNDVENSVRWMFIRVAQLTLPDGPSMPHDDAVKAAAAYMGIELETYQQQAKDWYDHNPWTVVQAKGKPDAPIGMTIVLPLTPQAYDDVLNGRRPSYAMTPADFTIPSYHLLLEGCAENPDVHPEPRVNLPLRLLMCMTAQLAALMRYLPGKSAPTYHWLSFAGTPTTRDMLLSAGFQATGKHMAKSGVEILRRTLDFASSNMRFLEGYMLSVGAEKVPPTPPLD